MTQELEFHISVTPVGADEYLVRTERVAPGVPLAEEQVSWPVEEWLAQARQLMNDPLLSLLQGSNAQANGDPLPLGLEADILFAKLPHLRESLTLEGGEQGNLDPDLLQPFADNVRSHNLVALGQQLYNSLFYGTLRDSWMTAQGIAQHRREVLRLRLGLKGSRVTRLPWEALHAGDRPIATGTDVVFSRYQPSKGVSRSLKEQTSSGKSSQNLKILMVLAGPTDRENLELKREARNLQQELQNRNNAPAMQITILEQPDRATVTQALEQNKYQVFHYSGHSNLGASGGELYLVSRRTGLTETLSGSDLAGLLANNGIQLAVFNSCRSANTATSDLTEDTGERNLAEALVKRGIPAVLAMAERIPDDVALTVTRLFYRNLDRGYPVDLSLSRARQGLISAYGSNQLYWVLPILYLHPEFDGYLNCGDRSDGLSSASAKQMNSPINRQQSLPPSTNSQERDAGSLEPAPDEFDDMDIESVINEIPYDDLSDSDSLVADLLRQLGKPSDDEQMEASRAEPLLPQQEMHPNQRENYRQPLASPDDRRSQQRDISDGFASAKGLREPASKAIGTGIQKKSAVMGSGSSKARRKSSKSWIQVVGAVSLCAFALLGVWSFRDQLFGGLPQPIDSPEIVKESPDDNFNKIDLRRADISVVQASAIAQFNKGNLTNGQRATEILLDRHALQEAKQVLDAVPKKQKDDSAIKFLQGRLAWQYVQAKNPDYSLNDVLRFWEAAVSDHPTSPLYYNALAFAYYAEGNFNRASDTWLLVLTLLDEPAIAPAPPKSDPKLQTSSTKPMQTPSPPNRDALTAYAGRALVLMKTAQNQPPTERVSRLTKAIELRKMVMAKDPLNYQIEALGNNWMWPAVAIDDWRSLQYFQ